jgi:hypothetical protein
MRAMMVLRARSVQAQGGAGGVAGLPGDVVSAGVLVLGVSVRTPSLLFLPPAMCVPPPVFRRWLRRRREFLPNLRPTCMHGTWWGPLSAGLLRLVEQVDPALWGVWMSP